MEGWLKNPLYLKCDASIGLALGRNGQLAVCAAVSQRDQIVVTVAVRHQRRGGVCLQEVQ